MQGSKGKEIVPTTGHCSTSTGTISLPLVCLTMFVPPSKGKEIDPAVAIEIRWFEAIHGNISSGGLLGLRVGLFL